MTNVFYVWRSEGPNMNNNSADLKILYTQIKRKIIVSLGPPTIDDIAFDGSKYKGIQSRWLNGKILIEVSKNKLNGEYRVLYHKRVN
jgi:hypothetical protein